MSPEIRTSWQSRWQRATASPRPVAHRVEHRVAGLVERLRHGIVSIEGQLGCTRLSLVVAVVVLEVFESVIRPRLSINVFVSERSDVATTRLHTSRRVDTRLETGFLISSTTPLRPLGNLSLLAWRMLVPLSR